MPARAATLRTRSTGFTLIELMVGMALGLLSVIIITQVMSLFEAQRRTTTGSADAQTNGGIALFSIARDLQLAGFGLPPSSASGLECTTLTSSIAGVTSLAPISASDGVAGANPASDTITLRYASSQTGGANSQITSMSGNDATVGSTVGCNVNDATLIVSGASCAVSTATAVAPTSVTLANTALASAGANLSCLGSWTEVTYAVDFTTGNLNRTTIVNGVTTTTPSVVGVVNLQLQYGISATANSNQVTAWVDPAGATWAAPTVADRNRIKAVRIAVIARNDRLEPSAVTQFCNAIDNTPITGLCAWQGTAASHAPSVDLSVGNANWNRYRYRVFETIIPVRNVIWAKDTF